MTSHAFWVFTGNILSIECSTLRGGVALSSDGRVLASETWSEQSRHGEFVVPGIEKIFRAAGLAPKDLKLIAVDFGPGRFTGVRVALNAARTLAYSLGVPVASTDSLSILAAGAGDSKLPVLSILNAHKNMVYAAINFAGECTHPPAALTIPELEKLITSPHLCVGDGYFVYESTFSPTLKSHLRRDPEVSDYPLVQVLALLAPTLPQKSWKDVEPLYIRASEAEEKLRTGLITGLD
ncbi:MAG: tRNA (adenosine(37)-N6)-threonylcarbamoyltransferase complex dimerization subunit type 1 TsaB [Bdellovibrionia bacterium]